MSSRFRVLAILLCLVAVACSQDDGDGEEGITRWLVSTLWPRGTRPMPSPNGQEVLFTQEELPAGLYLLRGGNATLLNPSGPTARPDYVWDHDGQRFSFSSPGAPGSGDAGIYLATVETPEAFSKLWDRGSDPSFLPIGNALLCAGPLSGGDDEGIWQIELDSLQRFRLSTRGVKPKTSPDGFYIAYLIPTGNPNNESLLAVINRRTAEVDTLMGSVINFDWLGSSSDLVLELRVTDDEGNELQNISVISLQSRLVRFIGYGTSPDAFPPTSLEFIYAGHIGDRLDGLYLAAAGEPPARISLQGSLPVAARSDFVVAQDTVGLVQLTRVFVSN